MKRTFVEVIMNIKDGETWGNEVKTIKRSGDRIEITTKGVTELRTMCFGNHKSYSLVEKYVSFTEAFEAYESGKIIKNIETGFRYKKNYKEDYCHNGCTWIENDEFDLNQIRGQWQILD